MATVYISKSKLIGGDTLERLRFAYYADQEAFKSAFLKAGLEVNSEEDLRALANMSTTGQDVKGIEHAGGKLSFNTLQILNYGYMLSYDALNSSGIILVE